MCFVYLFLGAWTSSQLWSHLIPVRNRSNTAKPCRFIKQRNERERERERERKKERKRRERGISENRILNARTIKLIYASLSQVYCIYSLENALINFAIQSRFYCRSSVLAAFKSHQSFWNFHNQNNFISLKKPTFWYVLKPKMVSRIYFIHNVM